MEFKEVRYRTRSSGTPAEDLGKAAVASIVLEPSGDKGTFWVETEAGPMQRAHRVVVDQIPIEEAEKIEAGLDSEDEAQRQEAMSILNKYIERSVAESNVYSLNNQSYVEEEIQKPSGRTRRRSTLITDRRLEEHFTGETPVFTPQDREN